MGGGEIALLNLVTALDKTRVFPVIVLASEGPLVAKLRDAGIETHVLPLDPALLDTRKDSLGAASLLRLRQIKQIADYTLRLARWARARRVDLIHANSLKADLYGGAAGRLAGIPVLWHVRDNIDAEYLPASVAAAFRALAHVIPQMVVANSESTLSRLHSSRRRPNAVVYSGTASHVLEQRQEVVHDGYRADQYSVDMPLPAARWSPNPVIALIGRIAEWKGQRIFLQAAASVLPRFPQARFWIVGSPLFGEHEYERSLHVLARELGIEAQVEFLGFRDDVPELMAEIDILVHASILGEPFGQVVIEGMAAGKPVIATNGGALPEIITSGETGLLVPMGNAQAMADAILTLLADPKRGRAMGAAGRQRVQERFTIAHTVRKVQCVYDKMLGTKPG